MFLKSESGDSGESSPCGYICWMTRPGVCRTMKSEGLVAFKFKKHSFARAPSIAFLRVDIPCQVSVYNICMFEWNNSHIWSFWLRLPSKWFWRWWYQPYTTLISVSVDNIYIFEWNNSQLFWLRPPSKWLWRWLYQPYTTLLGELKFACFLEIEDISASTSPWPKGFPLLRMSDCTQTPTQWRESLSDWTCKPTQKMTQWEHERKPEVRNRRGTMIEMIAFETKENVKLVEIMLSWLA